MAITKVSHTLATNPVGAGPQLVVQETQLDGIIIDIVTNIAGGGSIGRVKISKARLTGGSKWFKVEYGKIISALSSKPSGTTVNNLRETYLNWDLSRFCILTDELCYLVYTSTTNKSLANRIFPFDGFKMAQEDAIFIEINSAGNFAKLYY